MTATDSFEDGLADLALEAFIGLHWLSSGRYDNPIAVGRACGLAKLAVDACETWYTPVQETDFEHAETVA
jgi:hypothetical protein